VTTRKVRKGEESHHLVNNIYSTRNFIY